MKPDFLLDQAGWPAFLVDDSGTIRRANAAAVTLLGTVMEGEPELAASIWSPENPWNVDEFLQHLDRSSSPAVELRFRAKGGSTVCYTTTICSFVRDGKRFRLFQLLRDVQTPAATAAPEQPADEAAPALAAGIAPKEKLDCALQLIRTVALDFNNVLTTILGHTSLVLSRMEPGHPWRGSLLQVERSAERAAEIAQDLADFSRQDKDPRNRTPGNLNELIRGVVALFQGSDQAGSPWSFQLEKRLFTVRFDEAKLRDALARLLENAIEAVPPDGRIVVRTLNHSFAEPVSTPTLRLAAGHYVCVEIADNGCGIPPDALPRVFEPFFTTKSGPKHRGLGLAWVYGIVTNHGGVVSLDSRPGAGTTVRLFLPAQQNIVRDADTRVDDLRGHESILFVDDEEMLLNLGQTVLSAFGYQVLTANSGQRALDLFRNAANRIELVVTDLVMPGMSGRELVDHLRRLAPGLPILRTSGYLRRPAEVQHDTYLRKPFTSQELLRAVRRLLLKRKEAAPPLCSPGA
jgi:two-component system, cell cycle sensor histidine kinase and response regulator CckA